MKRYCFFSDLCLKYAVKYEKMIKGASDAVLIYHAKM